MNSVRCKLCNDIIISKHRHDFVTCKCGNISVDGGSAYKRRVGQGIEDGTYEEIEGKPSIEVVCTKCLMKLTTSPIEELSIGIIGQRTCELCQNKFDSIDLHSLRTGTISALVDSMSVEEEKTDD